MRVLVCGGRDFADDYLLRRTLFFLRELHGFDLLIHGGAGGADTLAGEWAVRQAIPVLVFPADWHKHGRAAGPIRNAQMLAEGKPDLVVAFPGGRGTANMVRQAKAAGVPVVEVPTTAQLEDIAKPPTLPGAGEHPEPSS